MKLNRPRLLLLVVLLALGGLLAVVWEPLWLAVAYEPKKLKYIGWPIDVYEKHLEWAPGPDTVVPAQVCVPCRIEKERGKSPPIGGVSLNCDGCWSGLTATPNSWMEIPAGWRFCTCAANNHLEAK